MEAASEADLSQRLPVKAEPTKVPRERQEPGIPVIYGREDVKNIQSRYDGRPKARSAVSALTYGVELALLPHILRQTRRPVQWTRCAWVPSRFLLVDKAGPYWP